MENAYIQEENKRAQVGGFAKHRGIVGGGGLGLGLGRGRGHVSIKQSENK